MKELICFEQCNMGDAGTASLSFIRQVTSRRKTLSLLSWYSTGELTHGRRRRHVPPKIPIYIYQTTRWHIPEVNKFS
jgi:hypothetical protein